MKRKSGPTIIDGDRLVIEQEPQPGVQPDVPDDVRRWMEDGLIDTIDLGSARDKNVPLTTWHRNRQLVVG